MFFTGDIAQPFIGASSFSIPDELQGESWIGNLEGSLVGTREQKGELKGVYNDVQAIDELKGIIPFKAFSIANNHLLDAANVKVTIDNLKSINVEHVGAGCSLKDAKQSLVLKDNDGTFYRILAFGWENIQCITSKSNKEGVNPYTRKNVINSVKEALRQKEPVICFMHWDYELERYPQPYDRQLAHELIDMGVAAVIGCHAHRVQPIEFYKGKPIVYGLGNFLFCQGHYFGGKLSFPKFCEDEYAFDINKDAYKLHYFHYDQQENRLEYVKSVEISAEIDFDGKAEFSEFSDNEYEKWFKQNRVQKKLLPIFHTYENAMGYWVKSEWIKVRGGLINLLAKMNLKSRNRANR